MRNTRVFPVKNRLAAVMDRPGGRAVTDMLRNAERRIAAIRDDSVLSLAGTLRRMRERVEAGRHGGDPQALDQIYLMANEVFAIAGTFHLGSLSEASYELCDLADHFIEVGEINWPAICVYVDGLQLLQGRTHDPEPAKVVLAGLRKVRARFITDAPAEPAPAAGNA